MWLKLACMNMAVKIVSTAWKLPLPLKNAVRCAGVNDQVLTNVSPRMISSRNMKMFRAMMGRFATAGRGGGCSLAAGKGAMGNAPLTTIRLAIGGQGSGLAGYRRCPSSVAVPGPARDPPLRWLRHLPHVAGETYGVSNNWWQYMVNPNLVS